MLKLKQRFQYDPSLMLYLPLYELDGAKIMSRDGYGTLCTVTGAMWTPQGHKFDGVDDNINCGNADAIAYLPNGFTFNVWVNFSALDGVTNHMIVAVDSTASPGRQWELIRLGGDGGRLTFYVIKADGTAYIGRKMSTASALVVGEWAMLTGVWDGGTTTASIKVYKNGVQVDDTDFISGTFTGITDTGSNFTIGAGHGGVAFTPATIGEVEEWRKSVTLPEIQQIYLETKEMYQG